MSEWSYHGATSLFPDIQDFVKYYIKCWMYLNLRYDNVQRIILFNDVLNTFYLQLQGIEHIVKDHSEYKIINRCRHSMDYHFRLAASDIFICSIAQRE